MADKPLLHEKLTTGAEFLGGEDYYQKNIPDCIVNNLNQNFQLRPYQLEAFGRFKYYLESYAGRPKDLPTQILFHMATGSGKTLIMSGLMLYLYRQGYRNFLFFVNSTNIINKTRDNFLNTIASKYLFCESVEIDSHKIRIREVENFQAANPDDINIVFSTIQGLHIRLNTPKENSITFDDFESKKIVLISDEAHHINAETKKANDLSQTELLDLSSWESTVNKIFNANAENILLEFTATMDLTNLQVIEKYRDKIILDYPLKAFRLDRYSKEVKVLQSDSPPFQRALQAILLSQFRRKIFEKYKVLAKPVILLKSKTINESNEFYEEFTRKIKSLDVSDLKAIKNTPNLDVSLQTVFSFMDVNGIDLNNLVEEIREDFSSAKCIEINSKAESEAKQIAVNTLEDIDNEYRAVFAVDKLNEGWDVLNLFDIVRLYDTRDAKSGKPGKTTMSEAQLIGRGARYFPFQIEPDQPLYQRKYDICDEVNEHELRTCEELYYHSAYNPRYIDELHTALEEIGIKAKTSKELRLELKPSFKKLAFFKSGFVFKNERIKYDRQDVEAIESSFTDLRHKVSLLTGYSKSSFAFSDQSKISVDKTQKDYQLSEFGNHVIRKAISGFRELQFSNLKVHFPKLPSISYFISSSSYLGSIKLEVEGLSDRVNNLTQEDKLNITKIILGKLVGQIQADDIEYKGSNNFKPFMLKDTFTDKLLNIVNDGDSDQEYGIGQNETTNPNLKLNLSKKDWFVFNENYGTSEEKYLVRYIDKVFDRLKSKYDEIYLIRNERHFKLFNFDDGRAFEPDFILFLIKNGVKKESCYQVFLEPKGGHLIKQDEWKQNFLLKLHSEHVIEQLWKDKEYIVWGMPFYNETDTKPEFEKEFKQFIC
ncbi:DEAD/DEAH box helicase family protein [Pseudomonadota bacterium]